MRLLDRNQYCVHFGNRCNYSCSYCINRSVKGAPLSFVETHTQALINTFNMVKPGLIMVSGGEPGLWQTMPHVIQELDQHRWVILTNLSFVPSWLLHENVVLVIAAFHRGQTKLGNFKDHLLELRGKAHVKMLVWPGDEERDLHIWQDLCKYAPTHLVPVSWPKGCRPEFLERFLSGELLTSLMYNSRFFAQWIRVPRKCIAGTKDMFQVNFAGDFKRCSQAGMVKAGGTIVNPVWDEEPQPCDQSCYCEWHHWAEAALANDNPEWEFFIETGLWRRPTPEQLRQFVMDMGW